MSRKLLNSRQVRDTPQRGWADVGILIVVVLCAVLAIAFVAIRHRNQSSASQTTPASQPAAPQSSTTKLQAGSQAYTLESGGIKRTYRVYVPTGLTGQAPLVIFLHGGGGSGQAAEHYYGWDKQADSGKFIVAYPDGLGPQVPAWNVDGLSGSSPCCGYPARNNISDVQFIKDLVTAIESQAAIDKQRVYATGISNGGIMSYTLACETDLFAAIGPDSATMLDSCKHPQPTSVIHVHGLEDTTIRFDGGVGAGSAAINGPAVSDVIADWRQTDNCAAPSSSAQGVVVTAVSNCANGRAVELITIANGGHGWPGSPAKSAQSTSGGVEPSQAIDATNVIWQFFAAHPGQ